ncbi:MAG TPA: hypothetical protein PLM33_00305 [Acidobacteriota bacterium]|jgi:energy-coupling factor transporter transmembrane protein EcfT|nr:hypothetical protein [Acidobacteriota bacterium]HRR25327.1 hypothetical protein [Acidobacteriota bacterium]HRR55496.1 hypothetical protein [Acidobacteriota bacterium]HRV07249.1 hypothetical protein [Acidobacteriota bacterium]
MTKYSLMELWGSTSGLAHLAPETRLLIGVLLLASVTALDYTQRSATVWGVTTILACTLILRPRRGFALAAALVGAAASGGFALTLLPAGCGLVGTAASNPLARSLDLILKGAMTALIAVTWLGSFTPSSLVTALTGLRVPRWAAAGVVQIICQAGSLWDETGRLATAVRIRRPGCRRESLLLLSALPQTWLLRLAAKAERVHLAMLARGWEADLHPLQESQIRFQDYVHVALTIFWCTLPWLR